MKLLFETTNPTTVKNDIIKLIKDDELQTWGIHKDPEQRFIKHTGNLGEKGVIKLEPDDDRKALIIQVIKFKGVDEAIEDFEGYYLGRFCEIMFMYFPDKFSIINKE